MLVLLAPTLHLLEQDHALHAMATVMLAFVVPVLAAVHVLQDMCRMQ